MVGERACIRCGIEFIFPFEGGYKYCNDCKHPAYLEQLREYSRLAKSLEAGEIVTTRPKSRFAEEYYWEWACEVCGIKHQSGIGARRCCEGVLLHPHGPIEHRGGFVCWKGEPLTLEPSEVESTISFSENTFEDLTSAVVVVGC